MTLIIFLILALLAYLIGSIPVGLILTKIVLKQDVRAIGSGNIGATNVLRTGNKKLAALTLLLDAIKGAAAPLIMLALFGVMILPFTLILGLCAIIGHCFPVWLKFKGGKGVATAIGALLAATPITGLAAIGIWLGTAVLFRISSLAALMASGLTPLITYLIYGYDAAFINALIAALVWIRHKDNIKRIIKGEEPQIGKKKEAPREPVSE